MTPTPRDDLARLMDASRQRARRSNGFETRMQLAEAHEACVRDVVRAAGWVCDFWGQRQLTPELRAALRRTVSPVRWAPDLLAARGSAWCFIDAKAEIHRDTAYFSLEQSAYRSHFSWWVGNTTGTANFVYVWDDYRASHIGDIGPLIAKGHARTGSFQGRGSGTPFLLIPKAATRPFDDVFSPTSRAHNQEVEA